MEPNIKFITLRKDKGPSQLEFAKKLGVSRSLIADIERGKASLSNKIMSKMFEIFDIEAGYFDNDIQKKNIEIKQGVETGVKQGKSKLKASLTEFRKRKIDLVEPYLSIEEDDLLFEIDLEIEDLKELHENYRKLLIAIYNLVPPAFFKKKFPLVPLSTDFSEYLKWLEDEYNPYIDQDGNKNTFTLIHKIFELYRPAQDHLKHMITILIDYFNRYSDFFLDDNDIKQSLQG